MSYGKRDFSPSDWYTFCVKNVKDIPAGPHFQALVESSYVEYSGYSGDPGTTVEHLALYVFQKQEDLDRFVSQIAQTDTKYVFYHVKGLGKATIKVNVGVDIE